MRFPKRETLIKAVMTVILPILTAVVITVPLSVSITNANTSHALAAVNRKSNVTICVAYNRVPTGIEALIAELRKQSSSYSAGSAAKAQAESFYKALAGDFPKLDCTQNPIAFTP